MGRLWPSKRLDFYEPRIHGDWLRLATADRKLSPRSRFMIRLLVLLVLLQLFAPNYLRWWIAQQTPGAAVPSLWRIHLISAAGLVLIYAFYKAIVLIYRLIDRYCRVRIRITDQFIQRLHGHTGEAVFWKHAKRATFEVVHHDAHTWTILHLYSTKRRHPMHVGIPNDQPIEPILEILADMKVPVSITHDTEASAA
ncbi:MAG: hypothetical protein ACIAXF_07790 [Phycisphaerales bacterium JB063]